MATLPLTISVSSVGQLSYSLVFVKLYAKYIFMFCDAEFAIRIMTDSRSKLRDPKAK